MTKSRTPRANNISYRQRQDAKDKAMYDKYTKLSNVRGNGVQKLTHDFIMSELVKDFFLDEVTIMRRIKLYAQNKDSDPKQLSIELK